MSTHARSSRRFPARAQRRLLLLALLAAALAVTFTLQRQPPRAPRPPATLADLWAGRAKPVLDRKWTSSELGEPRGGVYEGARIKVVGRTWYLFNRVRLSGTCSGHPETAPMGTQVRASQDAGATWGAPTAIVAPTPGTAWSCAATDGDAIYDAAAGVWRYLFQCLGDGPRWAGCYVERRDANPLGPFGAPAGVRNPVIASGSLWRQICDDPGDNCARSAGQPPITDEGTFDIFRFDGSAWWVGFHGYDGVHGYRGIARTRDFGADWEVDGAGGTPTGAVLDATDAAGWRERWQSGGPVGPGAASILSDGGMYYQLAEMPDENLECTSDQTWDLGLFRSPALSSTRWQQYPLGNPLVYSSRPNEPGQPALPCNVEYPSLFRDPVSGATYLLYGRVSDDPANDALYLYRLAW